eukprot:COSAG01_NODE_67578_length_266_cov_1.520958_1_plen_23_part_10
MAVHAAVPAMQMRIHRETDLPSP